MNALKMNQVLLKLSECATILYYAIIRLSVRMYKVLRVRSSVCPSIWTSKPLLDLF